MSFKSLLENKPTRQPVKPKSPTFKQAAIAKEHKLKRKVEKLLWKKYKPSATGTKYHEAVKRAGRLKRRRVARKLVYGAPEAIKSSWYRPSAVKERASIVRGIKKGGRKILRKLI
jgi:hypothetical protein